MLAVEHVTVVSDIPWVVAAVALLAAVTQLVVALVALVTATRIAGRQMALEETVQQRHEKELDQAEFRGVQKGLALRTSSEKDPPGNPAGGNG